MKNNTILDESDKIRAALDETSDDKRQRQILSMLEHIRRENTSGCDNDDEKVVSVALESAEAICNEAEEAFSFHQYNTALNLYHCRTAQGEHRIGFYIYFYAL